MKKLALCFSLLIFGGSFVLPQSTQTDSSFNELDMVELDAGSFTMGQDVQTYTVQRSVNSFAINKYETPYSLWYQVRKEAEKQGYHFKNPGQEGSMGRRGRAPLLKNYGQPVTMISWYDAMVWCNAFSEVFGLEPCYTYKGKVLKDSSQTAECDLAECNFKSNGFRLPDEAEWEYAARWSPKGLQKGNCVSGDFSDGSEDHSEEFAWLSSNADASRPCGTAGTPFSMDEQSVPGTGNPNGAGIFDMSGNLMEFCWDWFAKYETTPENKKASGPEYGSQRVARGGSFSEYTLFSYAADRYGFDANECYDYMGFRIVQSK